MLRRSRLDLNNTRYQQWSSLISYLKMSLLFNHSTLTSRFRETIPEVVIVSRPPSLQRRRWARFHVPVAINVGCHTILRTIHSLLTDSADEDCFQSQYYRVQRCMFSNHSLYAQLFMCLTVLLTALPLSSAGRAAYPFSQP